MQDFYAAFALQGLLAYYGDVSTIVDDNSRISLHAAALDHADEMLQRRST